ncbi:esterase/lipase family protein [Hephaestia sp. GCM10023244]|uniref:esterase/lipase family protein n=1 Tax=unclassified Hephaestia TaxID=2631281 RepID=UPI0020775EFA|nr:alpha/beta hydrolase [Hephaestia sp. MAHUQ-44]MCM8731797.1 alpha/beta hydrolase [Hephaestia sp. MAHUQ-44]
MATHADDRAAPSKLALAAELPRAIWSITSHAFSQQMLAAAPKGDGRPVLAIPGLFVSDRSNFIMRRYLSALGYRAFGWGLGHNFSLRTIGPDGEKLGARIAGIVAETGEPVTLIGVSLGGIMARFAAQRWPEHVREVITVASPFAGDPHATNLWRTYEWLTGERVDSPRHQALLAEAAAPLAVPATAIWSRSDGLVNGMICRSEADGAGRCIEVQSSHMGVQLKPEVLRAIADVLGGEKAD